MNATRATPWRAIMAALLLAVAAACTSTVTSATRDSSTTTTATATTATTATPAPTGVPGGPAVQSGLGTAVGHETYVDTSRSVPANGDRAPEQPNRTIETTVVHPTGGAGPYSLVVLAHGLNGLPDKLVPFAEIVASHGYVVLLPRFPGSAQDAPGGSSAGDFVNQPADLSYVLDRFLADPPRDVAGTVDAREIGAVGHSLGGDTVLGAASHPLHRDPRIKAAVVLSGVNIDFPGGDLLTADPPPVLFMQGDADRLLGPGTRSSELYERAKAPRFRLTILGGGHSEPYEGARPTEQSTYTATATVDFLDRYLKGDRAGTQRLTTLVERSGGLGKLESDPG